MAENRLDRKVDTRKAGKRKAAWTRPETLPSPTPEEGYSFLWVRMSTNGKSDPTNLSSKLRQGWVPVKATDQPDIHMIETENGRFSENIVIGGLLLCKAPIELVNERNAHFQSQANGQMDSVDQNLMRQSDPRMPVFNNRKSTTQTFGDGT
jgi:hypothetical protein